MALTICLKGECPNCGFYKLSICKHELDPKNLGTMNWRRFEPVIARKTKVEEPKTIVQLECKVTNPRAFLAFAKPKIAQFVMHQSVAKWQDMAYRKCLDSLKPGELMSLIDLRRITVSRVKMRSKVNTCTTFN